MKASVIKCLFRKGIHQIPGEVQRTPGRVERDPLRVRHHQAQARNRFLT